MKHLYISLSIFICILAGSFISNLQCNRVITSMSAYTEKLCENEHISKENLKDVTNLKEYFYGKKNMLRFFINKEHIEDIELNILLLENAVYNQDTEDCRQNSIELLSRLNFLKNNLTATD